MISSAMNHFSKRTDWENTPNLLTETIAAVKKTGREILDLSITNPTRCGFQYLKTSLLETLMNPTNLDYDPNPHGLLPARRAVSDYYAKKHCKVSTDRIFLTAGTSEAYSFLFRLLADPGDSLLAPEPSYPILEYLTALNDVRLERYPLRFDTSWRIDLETLEEKIASVRPKAILVVHPNNPTGNPVREEEKKAVTELARRYQTALISDEVFLDFMFGRSGPARAASSFAEEKDTLTFTLSGISKIAGLPQMKLSWIATSGPEALLEKAASRLEIISDTYLSVGTPVQNALPQLMERQPEIQAEIRARLTENNECLEQILAAQPTLKPLHTEAGWVTVLECPAGKSDEEWALEFLERDAVLTHPGYLYDFREGTYMVVSLLTPPEIFRKGISAMLRRTEGARR